MDPSFTRPFDPPSDTRSRTSILIDISNHIFRLMGTDDINDRWLVRLYKACHKNKLASVQALVESCKEGTLCDIVCETGDTPLHAASCNGNIFIVQYLVESDQIKVDVNLQDRFGRTAIHHACENLHTDIVKYLMESDRVDVDFNILDRDGNTPMHLASERGGKRIIEYFMQCDRNDVDVNARNNRGQTLLHSACRSGNRNLVEYLMESDRIRFIMEDTDGNSLLHHSLLHHDGGLGHIDVLEYLVRCPRVDAVANINKQNNEGDTPLHGACQYARTSCLRYLVGSDAIGEIVNLNIRNNNGDTLLHRACFPKRVHWLEMIAFLVHCDKVDTDNQIRTQNNDGDTPLHRLCDFRSPGFLPCLKLLLEEYQPNNDNNEDNSNSRLSIDGILKIQNSRGNTPLHFACKHQHRDAIEYLLQSSKTKGSFNIQNHDGDTSLHMACKHQNRFVIGYLLQSSKTSGSSYVQNHDGDTPVHLAFRRDLFVPLDDTTRLTHLFEFIQHQLIAATNLSDLSHLNNRVGDTGITKRLIEEAKPIANIQNRDGNTLLHLACMGKSGGMPALQQLVEHDSVDATLQNSDGDTPLHCICCVDTGTGSIDRIYLYDPSCLEKIKLLIESSNVTVDVNMMNNGGDTVLHRAVKNGLVAVVKYLMMLEEIDVHVRNKAGNTALECAQKATHDVKILALLESRLAHHPTTKRDRPNCSPDMSMEGEMETKTKRRW